MRIFAIQYHKYEERMKARIFNFLKPLVPGVHLKVTHTQTNL